ncbi:MAG: M13 family metallopeptidase [Myxococcota bacterium]|nr:M13 family metallopeptidase [Myxococcota bacterium]
MLLVLSSLLACPKETAVEAAAPVTPELPSYATTVLADMDPSADACSDFYQFACGGWMARTELPADKPSWTRSFSVIAESNRAFLKEKLEAAAADPSAGDENWAKLGAAYGACMDDEARNAAGVGALDAMHTQVMALKGTADLPALIGQMNLIGADPFYGNYIEGDYKDPTLTILHMGQGGLGLPDRDYYLKDDSAELLASYEATIASLLEQAGWADAETAPEMAKAVVAFETELAKVHVPRAELRDPTTTYHRIEREGLVEQVGVIDWEATFTAMGGPDITTINVERPEVLAATFKLVDETDAATLQAYLSWRLLSSMGSNLPPSMYGTLFDFYGKQVQGQAEPEASWKRCVRYTDGALGEALGQFFVAERFSGDSKPKAEEMIASIQDNFEERLPELDWMDEDTRGAAVEKKNTLVNQIGYPDTWKDYSELAVSQDHLANVLASHHFETAEAVARIGNPTDPKRWLMSPPTVNAYYHPLYNQMVFPAGILQPPFYDAEFPMAMNYGAIGMVMGHELTHGFDDQGRKFDPQGRMNEWWTPQASENFEGRADCVVEQFNGFSVGEDLSVNGELTLGENIADLGGLKVSFAAFQDYKAANELPAEPIPGITQDQLFFLAYAQAWCTKASPEYEKMQVLSDPHSPARYRIQGPLANLPEFHEAFGCEAGTPMHPENTCEVW